MKWEDWTPESAEEEGPGERESARTRREQSRWDAEVEKAVWSLLETRPEDVQIFDFPEELVDALALATSMKPSKARKRQVRLVTRLVRNLDSEHIERTISQLREGGEEQGRLLVRCELWRISLIETGDEALGELMGHCPDLDRQRFRQLVRVLRTAGESDRKTRAYKDLFQVLKELNPSEPPAS